MIETHRSFANMWECDENNHINVQFFMKRFEEAHVVFSTRNGHRHSEFQQIKSRHIRFHKEIRAGESQQILSGVVREGPFKGCVVHRMINSVTGQLCTTALDEYSDAFKANVFVDEAALHDAMPRGLPSSNSEIFDTEQLIKSGQAMAANFNIIRTHDLDENGNFLPSRIVSMFTDGAPHVWEETGITTEWLNQNGLGRVAVEMRLTPIAKPKLGDALQLVSRVGEHQGRTFRLDHQIETVSERKLIATGSVRALVMDLTTRKAVQLPDNFSASLGR